MLVANHAFFVDHKRFQHAVDTQLDAELALRVGDDRFIIDCLSRQPAPARCRGASRGLRKKPHLVLENSPEAVYDLLDYRIMACRRGDC